MTVGGDKPGMTRPIKQLHHEGRYKELASSNGYRLQTNRLTPPRSNCFDNQNKSGLNFPLTSSPPTPTEAKRNSNKANII